MYQARTSSVGLTDLVGAVSGLSGGRPLVVVEVGSYRGESARIMLDTGSVSRIYCVDPWKGGYDDGDLASREDFALVESDFDRRVGGDPRVVKCKGDIVDFVSGHPEALGSVDLVYIDAMHTYDMVKRDIAVTLERIRPRLGVSGHDYTRHWPGVRRAVDEAFGPRALLFLDGSWLVDCTQASEGARKEKRDMADVDPHIWDRFDMVAVLSYTGYQDRQPALWAELERVGLKDRVEWFWNFPSPFTTRFANSVKVHGTIQNAAQFNEVMGHYRILKTALDLGKAHVLVLEDDVRFIRDTAVLTSGLQTLPGDYDVAKLEWFCRGEASNVRASEGWARLQGFDATGGAAVAYSSAGLKWKTEAMERAARYEDLQGLLYVNDVYDTSRNLSRLKAYVAVPLLAVQEPAYWRSSNYGIRPTAYGSFPAGGSVASYGRA